MLIRLHGGSFVSGSGSWPIYDGTALAAHQGLVVVTVNHRLGALGFLDLSSWAGNDYRYSGNVGMLDLVQALQWVQDNIAAFGGDASRVTLVGDSGGGAKICALLGMPAAQGLFHRAIIESSPRPTARRAEEAEAGSRLFLAALGGAASVRQLVDSPVEELVKAQCSLRPGPGRRAPEWGPVLCSEILPRLPDEAVAEGWATGVPLVIGANKDEATFFRAFASPVREINDGGLWAAVASAFPEHAGSIVDAYRAVRPGESASELWTAIQGDYLIRIPTLRLLERRLHRETCAPNFFYLLTWRSTALDGYVRAGHGVQVPLAMGNAPAAPVTNGCPGAEEVAGLMSGAWASFAESGRPRSPGLPSWPSYSADERATMLFDRPPQVVEDAMGPERRVWDGII